MSRCLPALPPEEKTLTSPPVIGSIVLLTQITITMALLCQESGRQKAGNDWESRKGSGEACGGERWRKAVCVTSTGRESSEDEGHSVLLMCTTCVTNTQESVIFRVGCGVTCSTVSGEQISSPLRIMERCVNTSDSWKESSPSNSLTLLTTETHNHQQAYTDVYCNQPGGQSPSYTVYRSYPLMAGLSYSATTVVH